MQYKFRALKMSTITTGTVNIILSALKPTPATRSMINKAQYCQRHRL